MKAINATLGLMLAMHAAVAAPRRQPQPMEVERAVAERSGQQVQWQRDEAAREQAQQAVKALLRKQLTANSAAQIALLNNRSLQATFEEIGLSRAEVIEAGLLKNPTLEGSIRFPDRP